MLTLNPYWKLAVDIRRISYQKPREELVELFGEGGRYLSVLVLTSGEKITDPIKTTNYIASVFGGAAPYL